MLSITIFNSLYLSSLRVRISDETGGTVYDTGVLNDHTLKGGRLGLYLFSQARLINSSIAEINNIKWLNCSSSQERKTEGHKQSNLQRNISFKYKE